MNNHKEIHDLTFDLEAVGQRQPWALHHRGLEYHGEIILADTLDAAWGETLEKNLSFRLVFFTASRRIPPKIDNPATRVNGPTLFSTILKIIPE